MTNLQLFAFFGLPIMTVIFGLTVYLIESRKRLTHLANEPDLFDKSVRTPGE